MPSKSYKWTDADFASAKTIDRLLTDANLGNREFDRLTGGAINYGRIRDLRLGLKAPARLSEFLLICDVCHADPVQTLRDIIAEAQRIQAERDARERARTAAGDPIDIDAWADRIKAEDSAKSAQRQRRPPEVE